MFSDIRRPGQNNTCANNGGLPGKERNLRSDVSGTKWNDERADTVWSVEQGALIVMRSSQPITKFVSTLDACAVKEWECCPCCHWNTTDVYMHNRMRQEVACMHACIFYWCYWLSQCVGNCGVRNFQRHPTCDLHVLAALYDKGVLQRETHRRLITDGVPPGESQVRER